MMVSALRAASCLMVGHTRILRVMFALICGTNLLSLLQGQTTPWNTNGSSIWYAPTGVNVGVGTTVPGALLETNGSFGAPATSGSTQTYGLLRVRGGNGVLDHGIYSSGSQNGSTWIQATDATNLEVHYNIIMQPNEIPSATEVEEKGMSLGEMQSKLKALSEDRGTHAPHDSS